MEAVLTLSQHQRDLIADLWWNGSTSPTIARELGVTRNTVMGQVTRAKLQRSPNAPKPATHRGGNFRRDRPQPSPPHNGNVPYQPVIHPPVPYKPPPHHAYGIRCVWPVGTNILEDDFYCGKETKRGNYCAEHGEIAYSNYSKAKCA
jgi:GcrA cell cycle regulator